MSGSSRRPNHPRTGKEVVDHGFLAARAKALEIAAFLDRLDRSRDPETGLNDFRVAALQTALRELTSDDPGRAERLQLLFSDRSSEPADTAKGLSPAVGAARPAPAPARPPKNKSIKKG